MLLAMSDHTNRPHRAKLQAATQVRLDDAQAEYLQLLAEDTAIGSVSAALRFCVNESIAAALERGDGNVRTRVLPLLGRDDDEAPR